MSRTRGFLLGLCLLCGCTESDSGHDVPAPGTLQFESPAYGVAESAGFATIRVTRQGGTAGSVGVLLYIGGGSATGGVDYPSYIDYVESLHWEDGDASARVVTIPLFDDYLLEGDETVELILASPDGGGLGATDRTLITVVDSESPLSGSLQFSTDSTSEPESAGIATIRVTRTLGSAGAVSAQVHRVHSAPPGTGMPDYLELVADLTWADGDAAVKSVTVPIVDDAIPEPDEAVTFVLTFPTGGAALGTPSTAVLTLVDDD